MAVDPRKISALVGGKPALKGSHEEAKLTAPPAGVSYFGDTVMIGGARPALEDNNGRAKLAAADAWAKANGGHIVWGGGSRANLGDSGKFVKGPGPGWREQVSKFHDLGGLK